ncbi:MAG: galactose mutarotase [Ruminococcaceae bacterium]|nr:galactose mutarotase [Oscillospiraceae bacterium]
MSIQKKAFGILADGKKVSAYTLRNENGMKVKILDFGGTLVQIKVPDREGNRADVICGYDQLDSYINGDGYQGALIGRFGNRIARGRFTLDGKSYKVSINNNANSLHGGICGFNAKIWAAEAVDGDEPELILSLVSPDGEEGFPGKLEVKVRYKLTKDNSLEIHYNAVTDKPTILNLTNHAYFNLGGYDSGTVLDHKLWLDAESYLPTTDDLIPTGEIRPVDGTPFDFRRETVIRDQFDMTNEDIKIAGGFDHCFNFAGGETKEPVLRAVLTDEKSGRKMEMYTNQPCVQFYSGNFMNNGKYPFKNNYPQGLQNAMCLETQKMPDAINHDNFTDCVLRPGEVYEYTTIYKFGNI